MTGLIYDDQTGTWSRAILPYAGIGYIQVVRAASVSKNYAEAAQLLGVGRLQLMRAVKANGMQHWFPRRATAKVKHTKRKMLKYSGMLMKDAAVEMGTHLDYFKLLVKKYKIRDRFPKRGEARWIAERGYAV